MKQFLFYSPGRAKASEYACRDLQTLGYEISDAPGPDITHLLLPVPSFAEGEHLKGGGVLSHILGDCPEKMTVIGGNLGITPLEGYKTIDLLQDAQYLCENAYITAECAVRMAGNALPCTFRNLPVLVAGWGRIGKCLAFLLHSNGADVTVSARKEADLAMIQALGFRAIATSALASAPLSCRLLYNTVPVPLTVHVPEACISIDLASGPMLNAPNVIQAKGLPGKLAPESSGQLIARSVLRLIGQQEGEA